MAPVKDRRVQKKIGKQYGKQTNTIWTTGSKDGIETIEMTWQIYLTSKKTMSNLQAGYTKRNI